jgi:predicted small secreted protein
MKNSFARLVLVLLGAAFLSLATAACQTTKGLGKDVENLGENIQDGAK